MYSYLNLESTKTTRVKFFKGMLLYSYLNLESTKTTWFALRPCRSLYSYLNLESTKTTFEQGRRYYNVVQLLKS